MILEHLFIPAPTIWLPDFAIIAFFWIVWGTFENRAWKEHGENWILGHFKTYHLLMFALVLMLAHFGSNDNVLAFAFLCVWAPLMLDVVWWVIRYIDYRVNYAAAAASYGEPNAWCLQTDWDNWLNPPLICGCFWWWWVLAGLLGLLGTALWLTL